MEKSLIVAQEKALSKDFQDEGVYLFTSRDTGDGNYFGRRVQGLRATANICATYFLTPSFLHRKFKLIRWSIGLFLALDAILCAVVLGAFIF